MDHVIIGAGPAGVIAAETLRDVDPRGDITLIGDEPGAPYARMAIPYFLAGQIDETGTHIRRSDHHFEDLRIRRIEGRVERVSPEEKNVTLESGDTLSYDQLLIGTGSHPIIPPVEGIDLSGVQPCWTLEDARRIAAVVTPGSEVVLLGAGFVACIILKALVLRGARVTVLVRSDRVLRRMMSETAGAMIRRWCEGKGVRILTHTKVAEIRQNGGPAGGLNLALDSGEELNATLVVVAIGVYPNIGFLEGSGIETDEGILVNRRLQTNIPDVYAAGDVAQGRDFCTGRHCVQAIQPTAVDHGRIAALNMAGRETAHQGTIDMNVLDTIGLISSSFGLWAGVEGGESSELHEPDSFRYVDLRFDADVLVGANCVGLTQHVGVLRGLIQTRAPLGPWKDRLLKDPTRIMEAYLGSTQLVA
jgi:NADPH-dependent 2,4-dienoyl-CoA reductase/sulfur reductase-like enzyme